MKRTGRIEDNVTVVNIHRKKVDAGFSFLLVLHMDHMDKIILYHLGSTENITVQLSPINLQAPHLDFVFNKFRANILLRNQ